MRGLILVHVFLLWILGILSIQETKKRTALTTDSLTTDEENPSLNSSTKELFVVSLDGEKYYNIQLSNVHEINTESKSTKFKWLIGSVSHPEYIPSGVYFIEKKPTATIPQSTVVHSEDESSENGTLEKYPTAVSVFSRDTLVLGNSSYRTEGNESRDSGNYKPPNQLAKANGNSLDVENCTLTKDGANVRVTCTERVIEDIGREIPESVTLLIFEKCPGPNILQGPVLSHLTILNRLVIDFCRVRYVKSGFFEGLTNLTRLSLIRNVIMVLGVNVFKFTPNIVDLDLRGNNIMSLRSIAGAAQSLKNLTKLRLGQNKILQRILSRDLESLRNSSVEILSFYDCALERVDLGAFRPLQHLKSLTLSINPIGREALLNITTDLPSTSIQKLFLVETPFLFDSYDFITNELEPLVNTNISALYLNYNSIKRLRMFAFPKLRTLKILELRGCSLQIIHTSAFEQLTNLEELVLTNNKLNRMDLIIPSLQFLDLSYNPETAMVTEVFEMPDDSFTSMKKLRNFYLRSSSYRGPITPHTFSGLINLENLDISGSPLTIISDYAFKDLSNLQRLTLGGNRIKELSLFVFVGLKNLTQLNIQQNFISYLSHKDIFKPLESLEVLIFRQNNLKVLPPNVFEFNTKLEVVLFSNNLIKQWDYEIWPSNGSLRVLLLDNNLIEEVTGNMLTSFKTLEIVDLSDNPFICNTCGTKLFQDWIFNSGNTTIQSLQSRPDRYICTHHNMSIINITLPDELCSPETDKTGFTIMISLTALALFIVLNTLVAYKFRWYIRYMVFSLQSRVKRYRDSQSAGNYDYDAFVSYSSVDVTWVAEQLIPHLEGSDCGFRLCLHDRDFMAGAPITENILQSIDSSRKTIMVITEDYVKSNWCMFELHMAQHRLFEETRDALVLIKLKEVEGKILPKNLSYLMKTRTYIPWVSLETSMMGNKLFWKKLEDALRSPEEKPTLNRVI